MKVRLLILLVGIGFGCHSRTESVDKTSATDKSEITHYRSVQKRPKVSFTFDDGITRDIATFRFKQWNDLILASLKRAEITSVFFVTGSNKLDEKGKYLLDSWSNEGHQIANHTYNHPNFNSDTLSVDDFEEELLKADNVISNYDTYIRLFRFPYLKEGNTEEKIAGFRRVLKEHNYRNGSVTIDASDWYIDSELIKCIRKEGMESSKLDKYRQYYLQHIIDRANFYEDLSYKLTNRHISHTLLLHHNLASALFLDDLIQEFKYEGWEVIDANQAFQDDFFSNIPDVIPAGESLVWSVAKETGKYEKVLRYPAEDSRYEIPKMKKLGL